jgi:hypothetical protein
MNPHCTLAWALVSLTGCLAANDTATAPPSSKKDEMQITIEWPKGRSRIELPLHYENHLPMVKCRINRRPAVLLLDTGTAINCVFRTRLEHFGIELLGEAETRTHHTAAGSVRMPLCGYEVQLAKDLNVNVSRASVLPSYEGVVADGILGIAVLKAMNANIDLSSDTIVLTLKSADSHK